ncbi:Krueppel homolog 1 [Gryllus bimaculatus]|nr:Krueppel homolog 1 [Gryllus bimaculatus]
MEAEPGGEEAAADSSVAQLSSLTDDSEPVVILVHSTGADASVIDGTRSVPGPSFSASAMAPVVTLIQQGEDIPSLGSSAPSLIDNDQTMVLASGDDESLNNLVGSVPAGEGGADQCVALFQTENGQIVCLTYTVAPINGEEADEENVADVLGTNNTAGLGSFDIVDGLQEHFILDGLNASASIAVPSTSADVHISTNLLCNLNEAKRTPKKVKAQEEVPGLVSVPVEALGKLRLEDRLRVLEQLLPPPPLTASRSISTPPSGRDAKGKRSLPKGPPPPLRPRPPATAEPTAPVPVPTSRPIPNPNALPVPPTSLYACDLCGACFERPAQFYGHLRRHRGERVHLCSLCEGPSPPEFSSAAKLRAHEHRHHPGGRPHACLLCPARFDRASQLSYHTRRVHAGERPHACALCPKAFFKSSDLRTHLNVHLGIHKSVCETCGRRFGHVSNLIRHARTHSGVRPYPCPDCGRRFGQLNGMLQHRASHNDARRFPCPACGRLFKTVAVMRKHSRTTHGAYPPPFRLGGPTPSSSVGSAAEVITPDDPDLEALDTEPRPRPRRFYCAACGDAFEFAALLRQHERQHEGGELPCGGCGRTYASVEELKTHACAQPGVARPSAPASRPHSPPLPPPHPSQPISPLPPPQPSPPPPPLSLEQSVPVPVSAPVSASDLSEGQRLLESLLLGDAPVEEGQGVEAEVVTDTLVEGEVNGLIPTPTLATTESPEVVDSKIVVIVTSGAPLRDVAREGGSEDDGDAGMPLLVLRPRSAPLPLPPAPVAEAVTLASGIDSRSPSLLSRDSHLQDIAKQAASSPDNPQIDPSAPAVSGPSPNTVGRRKANRTFSCSECGKVFLKSGNYKQHLGMHFVDQKNHKCPICGQLFAWKSTLNKHVSKVHAEGEPPPRPPCELCGREYATLAQVQEHIRRDHFLQRPHACSEPSCTKRFYKKHDLKVHLRMHNKERPYICGSCGKTFYHLSHIIRHERIHSGLRPYKCTDCGRHFNQSSALKCHRRRHREKEHVLQQLQLQFQHQQDQEEIQQLNRKSNEEDQCLLEEQVLEGTGLEAAGLGTVELDAPTLETAEDAASLLTAPGLEGDPPEPLVELTVTDAEMVLGLPSSVFSQGLFPDVN